MNRQLEKMYRHALAYGSSAVEAGIMIHDDMLRREPKPAKPKKPWQKGFIPTVGKKPELPAPVLGGEWQFRERNGNQVEYQLRSENPFTFGWPRIKGDLVVKRWQVVSGNGPVVVHDEEKWAEQVLFTSSSHEACVVFVALDPDLTPRAGFTPAFGSIPKITQCDPQMDTYRALMAKYCQNDMVLFMPKVIAKLDKTDDEYV